MPDRDNAEGDRSVHIAKITICYGMTETSPVSVQSGGDDPLTRRVTNVGRIHPHVEAEVVDEVGNIAGRGVAADYLPPLFGDARIFGRTGANGTRPG